MARVPQDASLDTKVAVKELNDELRELRDALASTKATIPSTKDVETLQKDVVRLSKTPTYLDPNDVFRGSGPAHMHGYVPDPGPTPGTTRFLREDGSWQPGAGGGGGNHPDLTGRSDADQHPASSITNTPAGYIAADDVQEAINELDTEKLARSGAQDMLGDLDMGGNAIGDVENLTFTGGVGAAIIDQARTIYMTGDGEITGVKHIDMSVSGTGEGVIDSPRVIHMEGDDTNNEARIDGLERVKFNDEVSKSVIEKPSRVDWNTAVTAGTDYTAAEGRTSWDDAEDTLVVWVASGASVVLVAAGWIVKLAANG